MQYVGQEVTISLDMEKHWHYFTDQWSEAALSRSNIDEWMGSNGLRVRIKNEWSDYCQLEGINIYWPKTYIMNELIKVGTILSHGRRLVLEPIVDPGEVPF